MIFARAAHDDGHSQYSVGIFTVDTGEGLPGFHAIVLAKSDSLVKPLPSVRDFLAPLLAQ